MKKVTIAALAAALSASAAQAADLEAGKVKAMQVCGACHGVNGVSVGDNIPNLAAQRPAYIENQLKAFKEGLRKAGSPTSPVATMAAIATQLSNEDIANVAAFYASLPGAEKGGAKSAQFPNVAKTHVAFPEDYKKTFVRYHTINFPATKQVRHYYANPATIAAAKAGKPMPDGAFILTEVYSAKLENGNPVLGPDGFYVVDKPLLYTAMATGAGWGSEIPDMLRNGDWNYAVFSLDKQHRPINQAECLGCHKPLEGASYLFTLKQLASQK
ncbi:MAG: cytochrome P460 family protein [Betaproteobacteria bacterium]|nr:cytochrome P460 family protein [Betaproteobacteria bacterium]